MYLSPIISRAKKHYLKSLLIECLLMFLLSLIILFQGKPYIIELLLGMLAGFLPQCLLIYWYFFRQNEKMPSKMTALYQGEGLKWLATILLIVISFKLVAEMNVIAFFSGYILLLILNNLIPFLLSLLR